MEELENLVCQTQEQLEVAQKIMADENTGEVYPTRKLSIRRVFRNPPPSDSSD